MQPQKRTKNMCFINSTLNTKLQNFLGSRGRRAVITFPNYVHVCMCVCTLHNHKSGGAPNTIRASSASCAQLPLTHFRNHPKIQGNLGFQNSDNDESVMANENITQMRSVWKYVCTYVISALKSTNIVFINPNNARAKRSSAEERNLRSSSVNREHLSHVYLCVSLVKLLNSF